MRRLHMLIPIRAVRLALAIVLIAGLLLIGYVELASTFAG
jgi:hypothetical protein